MAIISPQRNAILGLGSQHEAEPLPIGRCRVVRLDGSPLYPIGISRGPGVQGPDVVVFSGDTRLVGIEKDLGKCAYAVLLRDPTETEREQASQSIGNTGSETVELLSLIPLQGSAGEPIATQTGKTVTYPRI